MLPTKTLGYVLVGENFVEEIHYTKVGLSLRQCHQEMNALLFKNEFEAKCWMKMINKTLEEEGLLERYQVASLGIVVKMLIDEEGNDYV